MITDKTAPTPIRNKNTIKNIMEIDTAAATLTVGSAETTCMQETFNVFLVRHVHILSNTTNLFHGQLESFSSQW